jgi:hypothetical protein
MPLYKYASACFALSEDVKSHLTGDEYEDVFDLLRLYSYGDWLRWRRERSDALRSLASDTPAKQEKKLSKLDRSERLLMVFALSQFYAEAGELLEVASELRAGGSYRSTAVWAWDRRQKFDDLDRSFWPWGGLPSYRDAPPPRRRLRAVSLRTR